MTSSIGASAVAVGEQVSDCMYVTDITRAYLPVCPLYRLEHHCHHHHHHCHHHHNNHHHDYYHMIIIMIIII